jgi:Domain of unknown function (DUF4129)
VLLPVEVARRRAAGSAVAVALALATLLLASPATADTSAPAAGRGQPTEEQVKAAVAQLKDDPNLGAVKKSHRLQWKKKNAPAKQDAGDDRGNDWLRWLADAMSWFASTARALLWVIGVLMAGILGLHIKRFLELRGDRPSVLRITMPTHVRDLDIRPESLPDDIGASALAMWERGEHRAALALLYRGALSRLTHVHGVPIRDSSTEGDCLRLANSLVPAAPAAYVARLIRVWQRAVYGSADPTDEEMRSLCAGFAEAVDKPASAPTEQAA